MGWMENANHKIAASAVGRWFQLDGSGHVSHQLSMTSLNYAADKV